MSTAKAPAAPSGRICEKNYIKICKKHFKLLINHQADFNEI